jgi:hypothetical protein
MRVINMRALLLLPLVCVLIGCGERQAQTGHVAVKASTDTATSPLVTASAPAPASATAAGVVFPRLSRVGIIPPADAAEKTHAPNAMLICGDPGWGDNIQLELVEPDESAQLDAGKPESAVALVYSKVESVTHQGQLFYVSKHEEPNGLGSGAVVATKLGTEWVRASLIQQRNQSDCGVEKFIKAAMTLAIRPPLTLEQFNAESPITITDIAGFRLDSFNERINRIKLIDSTNENIVVSISVFDEAIGENLKKYKRIYKLTDKGFDGYEVFLPKQFQLFSLQIETRPSGQWYEFEAAGKTSYAGKEYHAYYQRPAPHLNVIINASTPISAQENIAKRLQRLRDGLVIKPQA